MAPPTLPFMDRPDEAQLAIHEASHAVIARSYDIEIESVDIDRSGTREGGTDFVDTGFWLGYDMAVVWLASSEGLRRAFGDERAEGGTAQDLLNARAVAKMDLEIDGRNPTDEAISEWVNDLRGPTAERVREWWPEIEAVSAVLMAERRVGGARLDEIIAESR